MSTYAGNPTSWSPYDSYKDCSQRICSIYCPQWCYIIFSPPPPFEFRDDDSGSGFSPLIIAVIGILGSAFLLVSYFTIISKYCKGRNDNNDPQNLTSELEANQNQMTHDQSQQQNQEVAINGLDESLINSITVFKYKKGDGLIGGVVDCAVCLSEFQENESLRLLPKCIHAFHVPCIDKWLMSHSNCPLCRSNVVPISPPLPLQSGSSTTLNMNSLEIGRHSDLVLVIDDLDRVHQEEVFDAMVDHEIVQEIRRSNSLGSFSCHRNILIADILNNSEDEADLQVENCESQVGNGPDKLKRSNSMGRFVSSGLDKGKNLVLPH